MMDINKYLGDVVPKLKKELKNLMKEIDIQYIKNIYEEILKLRKISSEELGFDDKSLAMRCLEVIEQLCVKCQDMIMNEYPFEYIQNISKLMAYVVAYGMEYCFNNTVKLGAYKFSIVAIIRNERYIIEWIEYHRMVGVDHFYIYDNESTNNLKEEIKDYIDMGIVTYHYFPGSLVQNKAYNHAVENYQFETKYMAIIDGDEYIVSVESVSLPQLCDDMEQSYIRNLDLDNAALDDPDMKFLDEFIGCYAGGFAVNWRVYGTSYHKNKMSGLCIENYTRRCGGNLGENAVVKTIANPRVITSVKIHFCEYLEGYYNITENGTQTTGVRFFESTCLKIRINHYYSKSEEELLEKLKRGWPERINEEIPSVLVNSILKQYTSNYNEVEDFIMERYVDEVKKRVNCYENMNRN